MNVATLLKSCQFTFTEEPRYRIDTPFVLRDGDHITVILKKEDDNWIVTDEGKTLADTSDPEFLFKDALEHIRKRFDVIYNYGELTIIVDEQQFGAQLHRLIQGIRHINSAKENYYDY